MTSPSYGDPTQIRSDRELADLMIVVRDRIAEAQTTKDLDVALADFAVLRAEKDRRDAGGLPYPAMHEKFLAADSLDYQDYGGDDPPEPNDALDPLLDEEPDAILDARHDAEAPLERDHDDRVEAGLEDPDAGR